MDKKLKEKVSFNYNTPLGDIIKHCRENDLIFEINEKGYRFYPLIANELKEKDIVALGKVWEVHVKNQGKKRFSDFGKKPKRITKKQNMVNNLINTIASINKIIESGYYENCWKEKFPYIKLSSGLLIVYHSDKIRVKMTIDNFGKKNYLQA